MLLALYWSLHGFECIVMPFTEGWWSLILSLLGFTRAAFFWEQCPERSFHFSANKLVFLQNAVALDSGLFGSVDLVLIVKHIIFQSYVLKHFRKSLNYIFHLFFKTRGKNVNIRWIGSIIIDFVLERIDEKSKLAFLHGDKFVPELFHFILHISNTL